MTFKEFVKASLDPEYMYEPLMSAGGISLTLFGLWLGDYNITQLGPIEVKGYYFIPLGLLTLAAGLYHSAVSDEGTIKCLIRRYRAYK